MSYDVLKDLEDFKEVTTYCRYIVFKIEDLGMKYRVRIQAGRFGYDKEHTKNEMEEIRGWLETVGAVEVTGSVSKEMFFS